MKAPDVLYLALFGIWLVFEPFVVWPAFVRRLRADAVRARTFLWSSWIALLWMLTGAGVALWVLEARSWEALRFVALHGWRLWVATGLVAVLAISYARRGTRIARSHVDDASRSTTQVWRDSFHIHGRSSVCGLRFRLPLDAVRSFFSAVT